MIGRMRTRALWLAAGLILGSSALAFAGVATDPVPPVVQDVVQDATGSVPDAPGAIGKERAAAAKAKGDDANDPEAAGERKRNHGFYVSAAAHCEDVSDPENELTFTAPSDCQDNGEAHGSYVREVARSRAGKADKPAGPDED